MHEVLRGGHSLQFTLNCPNHDRKKGYLIDLRTTDVAEKFRRSFENSFPASVLSVTHLGLSITVTLDEYSFIFFSKVCSVRRL